MRYLIKICSLPLVVCGLTACGGGGGGGSNTSSSVTLSSSVISSSSISSSQSSSSSSSSISSSQAESSSSQSSLGESVGSATNYTKYTVAEISNCGLGVSAANKTFALFADYDSSAQDQMLLDFGSWNHATNGSTTEWVNLKYTGATYNYSNTAKMNSSCNGVDTLNMILVKKIADWDHQHANGFKKITTPYGYKYGDISNLIIDLKINSAKTFIPEIATLKTTYTSYVNASVVDALDEGKVNIGITMYDGTSLNAAINIQLDQSTLLDKWVRVTIPVKDMTFYNEVSYNRTPKTLADLSNVVINEVLFVAETKSGVVLRNTILNNWSTATPETFKEMDLSFKKIEFQLK
jgi:hypothetical protein